MADDHEDYETGAAPAAHKVSHQVGGTDEISVAGLAGETLELAAHKILPTVHQDAPGLIETHRLVAGAHHAKYTDAEARSLWSPMSIPPASFFPRYDTYDWYLTTSYLRNRAVLTTQYYIAPVIFPPGITITKLTLYGYRDDVSSSMRLRFYRVNRTAGSSLMADILCDWTTGWSSLYDDSISYAVIDNIGYSYALFLDLNPNDDVLDVRLSGAKIEFTG